MKKSFSTVLNRKEIEVLKLICKQYSNPEIAVRLGKNLRTVDGYRESLRKKIKAKNVVGLVLYASKQGIHKM